jgi:hypothetical protein
VDAFAAAFPTVGIGMGMALFILSAVQNAVTCWASSAEMLRDLTGAVFDCAHVVEPLSVTTSSTATAKNTGSERDFLINIVIPPP